MTVVPKTFHEIRDPIHVFVRLDSHERKILESRPFQRLRHVHQLGMTYLLYPGATHRRFEHSLGVMELASRVFEVVTRQDKITDEIRSLLPETSDEHALGYWKRALRMAALCHDLGHLPFSHAAEKELLPPGWDHEKLTREIICDSEMRAVWERMTPPLRADDVVKLAVGPKKATDLPFTDWETILAEIIVGDAFGVDRMDYLIRDSHHIGVAYGRFDHYRLVDTLRILPAPPSDESGNESRQSREPSLGIEEGGLLSAEALLLARYFMYSQVYLHPVRMIYDIHLKDFLEEWLPEGTFSTNIGKHLALTDNQVICGLFKAADDSDAKGHDHAKRILGRDHFRLLYKPHLEDLSINPEAGQAVKDSTAEIFGSENVKYDRYVDKGEVSEFPVLTKDKGTVSSTSISKVLGSLPPASADYVFVRKDLLGEARQWLDENRQLVIQPQAQEET